jgi:predicted O-linked N-acetylglucosamine transferase (SPINDLY family)
LLEDILNNDPIANNIADLYPEKMIYVPGSWMIADPSIQDQESRPMMQENRTTTNNEELTVTQEQRRRGLREQHHIPIDTFVYGYFGRLWKLDDNVFATWCSIIEHVPGSVLLLLDYHDGNADAGGAIARIRKQWSNHGGGGGGGRLDANRLIVLPPFDRSQHIAAQEALVDVSLDSVSYSGGATSLDSLLAHRPIVHCPGGFKLTQRSAGSVLTAAGLADVLVGKDLREYEEIAVRLGLDKVFYKQVQQRVANDSTTIQHSVLFQPQIGIGAMVLGMRQAYNLWRAGHAPQTIFSDQETHDPPQPLAQGKGHSEL